MSETNLSVVHTKTMSQSHVSRFFSQKIWITKLFIKMMLQISKHKNTAHGCQYISTQNLDYGTLNDFVQFSKHKKMHLRAAHETNVEPHKIVEMPMHFSQHIVVW